MINLIEKIYNNHKGRYVYRRITLVLNNEGININLEADRANFKWFTDITEFNLKGEKLYLSPILILVEDI